MPGANTHQPRSNQKPTPFINIFFAFAQPKNPGPAGIAVLGLVDGRPVIHKRYVDCPVTNMYAGLLGVRFCLQRLALVKRPGAIWTNFLALTGTLRITPGCSYADVIEHIEEMRGTTRILHLPNLCESRWLEEAQAASRSAFEVGQAGGDIEKIEVRQ